jgi:hypothetical protein
LHRYVDGRRNLQITLGDFYSCLRQHGRLLRVADQDPHGLFTAARLFAERAFDRVVSAMWRAAPTSRDRFV